MITKMLCKFGFHGYTEISPALDARYLECKCCGKIYVMC